jgi:hypothetical protein
LKASAAVLFPLPGSPVIHIAMPDIPNLFLFLLLPYIII